MNILVLWALLSLLQLLNFAVAVKEAIDNVSINGLCFSKALGNQFRQSQILPAGCKFADPCSTLLDLVHSHG